MLGALCVWVCGLKVRLKQFGMEVVAEEGMLNMYVGVIRFQRDAGQTTQTL